MTGMRGHAVAGKPVRFRIWLGGLPPLPIRARVTRVDPQRELRWLGGIRGILLGERYFLVRPHGGGTRLVHGEHFSGVLGRAFIRGGVAARIEAAYQATNRALQSVVEGAARGHASASPRVPRVTTATTTA